MYFTFCLSLMEPLPKTAILVMVSSWSRFIELPFGPSNFPTKLNCKRREEILVKMLKRLAILQAFWPVANFCVFALSRDPYQNSRQEKHSAEWRCRVKNGKKSITVKGERLHKTTQNDGFVCIGGCCIAIRIFQL